MFYTIYKVTNTVNKKVYIGKHQTKDLDDGYMGSGKYLKRAIEKYGIDLFVKEILFVFDNESDMNAKEASLVTKEFVKESTNYNLCPGGHGGFGYINENGLVPHNSEINKKISDTAKRKKIMPGAKNREAVSMAHKQGKIRYDTFTGKNHTQETKQKISALKKNTGTGTKNSQFGTMWITNGTENKKIKKDSDIPNDWYKGYKPKISG